MNKRKLLFIMGLVMALAVLAWGINPGWAVTPMPNPGGVPDYFATPNWANSPMPTVSVQGTPTLIGNPLVPRQYATDFASPPTVFVVVPGAVLPAGTLLNFQSLNQATPGGSPTPSGPNTINAYILRPTGTAGQYTVVFDSGQLSVPLVLTDTIQTYDVSAQNFSVQTGDVIAFYGQGIPVDTGAGQDILSYPAPTQPMAGNVITLGQNSYPIYPQNRTYSIAANVSVGTTVISGGIRKFVDTLPGLGAGSVNNLGQYIPVAIPDTTTYSGSDYYEIELGQYTKQMHSDMPATTLRGYRQTNTTDPTVSVFQYLGPLIVASKDRPVRIKFTNNLPAGNLFVPVDTTIMGSGDYEINYDPETKQPIDPPITGVFSQNRATLHLHGGHSPWISDGTPHQWVESKNESTPYPKGVSVAYVPDMWFDAAGAKIPACANQTTCAVAGATNNPGPGAQTFYWSNQQSSRLMFYHDHAWGITRLNVYVGEAAGLLVTDQTEQNLVTAGLIPADQIPLIIQDKTFVSEATITATDPTWNWGSVPGSAVTGDLWWPHVYMPAQNPYNPNMSGINDFGRWHYGPWFFPPTPVCGSSPGAVRPMCILTGAVTNPLYNPACVPGVVNGFFCQPPEMPGTPNPSWGAEAFLDTMVVNGTAYPAITVQPKSYRLRILNAAHDRFLNLQLYIAADKNSPTTVGATGAVLCDGTSVVPAADCTEVKMVPAAATPGFPETWPTDGREGGVPDPATVGPSFIQIGTEGGFLPQPAVLPNQPVQWNMDPTMFNVGNVLQQRDGGGTVILGPAERADVIVDFSAFAGKTLILYNDAPTAFPALDPHYDYYTGAPDRRDIGGAPPVLPGFGPNVRTVMQIQVAPSAPAPAFNLAALQAAFVSSATSTGVFESGQEPVIVGQSAYNSTYNTTFPAIAPYWGLSTIFNTSLSFMQPDGTLVTNYPMSPKAIHDEMGGTFDDYGRMSAKLGLEVPFTNAAIQNFVLQNYVDPVTEIVKPGEYQLWKITHNGVDTHPVHFHLFEVQLINRVGWDGFIRLPDDNELGWKDTVRVSPLEDTIVALRPAPALVPFKLPNSIRPLNPRALLGSTLDFSQIDPATGGPMASPVTNEMTNFGWEFVWHCHILSHEENDMMRSLVLAIAPDAPSNLTAAALLSPLRVDLAWTDNALNETDFTIQRATDPGFTTGLTSFGVGPDVTTFTDDSAAGNTTYYYRLFAANTVGSAIPGYPTETAVSAFTNTATVTTPVPGPAAPTNLAATINTGPLRVTLTWIDASNNETSFRVWRSVNGGVYTQIGTVNRNPGQSNATGGTVTFNNTNTPTAPLVPGNTYTYYVIAVNANGSSLPSNTVSVTFSLPAAPTNLTGAAVRIPGNNAQDRATLTWTDNANNETSFQIQRALTPSFAFPTSYTVGANVTTFSQNVSRALNYYYRVRTVNAVGNSAWSNFVFVTTP